MKSARRAAAEILIKMESDSAFSALALNSVLKNQTFESQKDGALVTMLVYGVTERRITLDYNLSLYLKDPIKKLHPAVVQSLRIGAYQILFADRIPDRAAVNESVSLVKEMGAVYAAGMVNAVLRRIAENGLRLPDQMDDDIVYLSVKYSCPQPLIVHFIRNYGMQNTVSHLEASLEARPLFIRRNTVLCAEELLIESVAAEGASVTPSDINGCYILSGAGDVTKLNAYQKGYFHVQDYSSQLAVSLIGIKPGDTVVDCCAAPGGKSFTMAQQMQDKGMLYACDMYLQKTQLIKNGAERLSLRCINAICDNAEQLWRRNIVADAVLCDVPCSGFGVIGRKPEIKYKNPSQFDALPSVQYAILSSCARMVKPGGRLMYSTCTLNPAENERVCERFISEHQDFLLSTDKTYLSAASDGYYTAFASPEGGDGFFAALFERKPA